MRTRHEQFTLEPLQKRELEKVSRAKTSSQRMAFRSRIIVASSEGLTQGEIAAQMKTSRQTVSLWQRRFKSGGMAGLADAPGRGRKPSLPEEALQTVIAEVVQPPSGLSRWSCRKMARHAGISKASVQRLWHQNDLKPHLQRVFKISKDACFEQKFWDVIGIYLDPPQNAVVLCCDEKSQCQALERRQPGLPLGQGHIRTRTHDYYRHGTVCLFAALDYLHGKIISQLAPRHRHQEWLRFLKQIERETTADLAVHLILDNYSSHKHPKVTAWLNKHPRFHLHYTPTSSSWMNLVERFFRDLTEDILAPGSFPSVSALSQTILDYIAHRNLAPKRYIWRAKGEEILARIERARAALQAQTQ